MANSSGRQTAKRSAASSTETKTRPKWVNYGTNRLLEMRMCDLGLAIPGTPLEQRIDKLYEDLDAKGLRFRPHCWLSEEWFSPDGVPGIAIPFYLAHRRLMRLEKAQILEVEGGTEEWCLRILRHEAGHAIDNAYRLHRRRRWREIFGRFSEPYPETYQARPYSKSYVLHLEPWYAQSHPSEDFAETFAVWLKPRSRWRTRYLGWPAMKKLEYVDELMSEIADRKPSVTSRAKVDPVHRIQKTLQEYYDEKRARYGLDHANFYDHDLRRLFSDQPEHARNLSAAVFLRRIRSDLRRAVARWTAQYQYTIDQLLGEMIERCRELNLRVDRPEPEVKRDALAMLTVQTMNYIHTGRHRFAL